MNPASATVAVYQAETLPGPDGTVEWWEPCIDDIDAVLRLENGEDIVVRGPDRRANRNKARELMDAAYGGFEEDQPHGGRMATSSLPSTRPFAGRNSRFL